jgi:hypothetical protein
MHGSAGPDRPTERPTERPPERPTERPTGPARPVASPSGARQARRSPRRRRTLTAPTSEIIDSHHLVADKIDRERPGGAAVLQVLGDRFLMR